MDLAEIVRAQATSRGRRRRLARARRIRPAGVAATDEVRVARQLRGLTSGIDAALREQLFPLLRRLEPEFLVDAAVVDDFGDEIQAALERIRSEHLVLAQQRAELLAGDVVTRVNRRNRERFYQSVESVAGINLAGIVQEGNLETVLRLKTRENVALIRSIPEDYFDRIERLVYESVIQGRKSASSMIEELRELGAQSDRRARFIARDQTAKLNAAMNRERNQALGITEYVWKTVRDERVRESHAKKHGQRFRWDDPPADTGHPGEDYQCRCVAEPVIEL